MLRILFGLFVVLHGLVHIWYVVLSQRLIEVEESMGWTGESWLFSRLLGDAGSRALAAVAFAAATLIFLAGGVGVLAGAGWWRSVVVVAAAFSSVMIVLFWDGSFQMPTEKGLIALLINAALLVAVLALGWPPEGS